jgi:hypothetical protein
MIHLQVRGEGGAIVTRGSCGLNWSEALGQVDPGRFPLLSSLLPYADTMFNSRQAERLRREVSDQSVRDIVGDDAASEIERLCRQVEDGSHLYLWFLGD